MAVEIVDEVLWGCRLGMRGAIKGENRARTEPGNFSGDINWRARAAGGEGRGARGGRRGARPGRTHT